jgi:hypothetical protein
VVRLLPGSGWDQTTSATTKPGVIHPQLTSQSVYPSPAQKKKKKKKKKKRKKERKKERKREEDAQSARGGDKNVEGRKKEAVLR